MQPTFVRDAIVYYHDLCTPERADETWQLLEGGMRSRSLLFGGRLLCNALRPQFLSLEQWRYLSQISCLLSSAFAKAYAALDERGELREKLWLSADEEWLAGLDPGYAAPVPMGRLDAFLGHTGHAEQAPTFQFVEYNAESPAAIGYEDGLTALFLQSALMQAFTKRFDVWPLWGRPAALQTLLRCYRQWGGRDLPRIAIVDWLEVPTASEFIIFRDYFQRQGLSAVVADARDLDFRQGTLFAAGQPVDLVYKRVLTSELLGDCGLANPLVDAVRHGAVCMVNAFRSSAMHKKASLAVISDEASADLFAPAELQAIRRHLPWTRRVEDRQTRFEGRTVDLLPFLAANRERLVLKPNDGYGGKGIVLGWEVDDTAWEVALQEAIRLPTVAQVRVEAFSETFPCYWPDGGLAFEERLVDCDPYLFDGAYVGSSLTRLSAVALLNVTAGGGSLVPTFVLAGAAS